MAVVWNAENAAHLLRRATFGARPKDVDKALKKGFDATIEGLFKKAEPDTFGKFSDVYLDGIQAWWLRRMLKTKAPLTEKLTLLWHNHFATGFHKIENARFMHLQNQVLRKNALGNFQKLVLEVSKSAAMLIWLDGETNIASDPNENFARELQELFTTGVLNKSGAPNYTENDVVEAARAFTGWGYTYPKGKFEYHDYDHDFDPKTFKGQTSNFAGEDIVALLAVDPATARRVAWRLWNEFAYPVALDDAVLDPLEQAYLANGTELRPVVELMFRSDAFYSSTAKYAHVKSPCEWLVGTMRLLGGKFSDKHDWMDYDLAYAVDFLGQAIFDPPSVFGWKENLAWTSSNGVFSRLQYSDEVATSRKQDQPLFLWQPTKVLPPKSQWSTLSAVDTVNWFLTLLGPVNAAQSTIDALVTYLETDSTGSPTTFALDDESVDSKIRGLVALILSSPEYQLA